MPKQELRPGDEVLAVKVWRDGRQWKHWERPRRGRIAEINHEAEHGIFVIFPNGLRLGFDKQEVWSA